MLFLFQAANPLSPIWQYGAQTGSAFICVGLFIWSQIQINGFKTSLEANTKAFVSNSEELKDIIEGQTQAQRKTAEAVQSLAESVKTLAESQRDQLDLIREMSMEQKLISANQTSIMNGFQRVVEQLIAALSKDS